MGTAYSDIYDRFLVQIKDWKIDALYAVDPDDMETYLQGFLILSVPLFSPFADQDLERNDTTGEFTEILTDENITILSKMMVEQWLLKEIQDIRQINLHVTDKDFKIYSEAQNLREKSSYLIQVRESISQMILDYSWGNNDWESWVAGDFGV